MDWKNSFPKENRYFETENGILYCENNLKILSKFLDNFMDLIILDPPYINYTDIRTQNKEWALDRNWDLLFEQILRMQKDLGYTFLFGASQFYIMIANIIKKYFRVYYDLIWVKPAPVNFLRSKERPLCKHELILCLVKKDCKVKNLVYNYKTIGGRGKSYKKRNNNQYNEYANVLIFDVESDGFRYPTSILEFPNKSRMKKSERTPHPSQKPIGLLEWFIKGFTNEGGFVLDPFAGSGTTLVVSEQLNRNWIGIEINEEYCKIIKERLLKIESQGELF